MWFIGLSLPMILIGLAVRCLIIFGILPIHEYAHARMAFALGDDTASLKGRMTLNPLAHIDWVGAACIMLIGFGWAKPVPVNPYRFTDRTHKKRSMALTALAGPLSNLIVALIASLLFRVVCSFGGIGLTMSPASHYFLSDYNDLTFVVDALNNNYVVFNGALYEYTLTFEIIYQVFATLITINLSLAIFNMIPVPPLDGSKILAAFIPDNALYKINEFISKYGMVITIVFVALIYSGVLSGPLGWLNDTLFCGFWNIFDWLFNLLGLEVASIV